MTPVVDDPLAGPSYLMAQSIRDTMPKPDVVKKAATAAVKVTTDNTTTIAKPASSTLALIVTSLGKVGGGGYSTGAPDAQR